MNLQWEVRKKKDILIHPIPLFKSNDHSHRIQNPLDQYYVDVISRCILLIIRTLLVNQNNGDTRPIFFCEYAHAMGNSAGNLKEFWDQWRTFQE
jgi:beta-galactosidase